jgi:hypothetical protein
MANKRLIIGLAALVPLAGAHALDVTPESDAADLVNTILGSGISVSGTPTYTGAAGAAGTFTGGVASGIGIESGIVLTSGTATLAEGPNSADDATGDNGLAGDADLDGLIPGFATHDATILTFDFTTDGGDLYFNFVFGSEEYNEWVGSAFNDVFGFFLDGVNIALIPATSTPVAINNVNTASNSDFYNNNDPSDTATPFDIEYDGFTDVFTAEALGIGAGTHTIKLAIADAGDWVLDSGVFIQAGTFSDTPTDPNGVPDGGSVGFIAAGALLLASRFIRRKA